MIQRSQQLSFTTEAGESLGVAGDLGRQHLDRDVAPEARVSRAVDLAPAPRPEGREDLVGAEGSDCERHPCLFSGALRTQGYSTFRRPSVCRLLPRYGHSPMTRCCRLARAVFSAMHLAPALATLIAGAMQGRPLVQRHLRAHA